MTGLMPSGGRVLLEVWELNFPQSRLLKMLCFCGYQFKKHRLFASFLRTNFLDHKSEMKRPRGRVIHSHHLSSDELLVHVWISTVAHVPANLLAVQLESTVSPLCAVGPFEWHLSSVPSGCQMCHSWLVLSIETLVIGLILLPSIIYFLGLEVAI